MHESYSTSEQITGTLVKNSRLLTVNRLKLKENVSYLTSLHTNRQHQHQEYNMVKWTRNLANQLAEFFDPFFDAPARHFKTGVEIGPDVMKDLLALQEIRGDSYTTFTD